MLFQFAIHLTIAATLLAVWIGLGGLFNTFLLRRPKEVDFRWFASSALLGLASLQILATVCLTYFPLAIATHLAEGLVLGALFSCAVQVTHSSVPKAARVRAGTRVAVVLVLSVLLGYLPFCNARKAFLASEGSGDHTIYLGAAKFLRLTAENNPATQPRLGPMVARLGSGSIPQAEAWNNSGGGIAWMLHTGSRFVKERVEPWFYPGGSANSEFSSLANDPEVDSAERLIRLGWDPAWWALPWGLLCTFSGWIPPETAYMSLLLALYSVVSLGIQAALPNGRMLAMLGFVAVYGSAGFMSVGLNHYYPQLLSIAATFGLFLCLGQELERTQQCLGRDLVILALFSGASLAHYWACAPWVLSVFFAYLLVRCLRSGLARDSVQWRVSWKDVLTILSLVILLVPQYLASLWGMLRFLAVSNVAGDPWATYLGKPLESFSQGFSTVLGVVAHTSLAPFTSLNYGSLVTARYAAVVCFGIAAMVIGAVAIRRSSSGPKSFTGDRLLLFSVLAFSLMTLSILHSRKYTYNFNKAAFNSFPFLIVAMFVSADSLWTAFPTQWWRRSVRFAMLSVCGVWIISSGQVRVYQMKSFWLGTDRSSLLYTELGLPSKAEGRVLYYPASNTDFSLLETLLVGRHAVAIGQYWFPTYQRFAADSRFDQAAFVVPSKSVRQYHTTWAHSFQVSPGSGNQVWPMSPYLDMKKTRLPALAYLDRSSYLEFVLKVRSPVQIACLASTESFSSQLRQLARDDWPSALVEREPRPSDQFVLNGFSVPWASRLRLFRVHPTGSLEQRVLIRFDGIYAVMVYEQKGKEAE